MTEEKAIKAEELSACLLHRQGRGAFVCTEYTRLRSSLAWMQIKTIWSVLLRNFELKMVDPFPEQDFESMVVGPKPCRVHFRRRTEPFC